MSQSPFDEERLANAGQEEIMAALFTDMVSQLAGTALVFLGRLPHPETGETVVDLASAKMFIDQLEMLEFKTRGNLGAEETRALQEGIAATRQAFAEEMESHVDGSSPEAPILKPGNR